MTVERTRPRESPGEPAGQALNGSSHHRAGPGGPADQHQDAGPRGHEQPHPGSDRGGHAAERDIPFAATRISREARAAVQRVLASGWVTTGHETEAFEQEFAAHVEAGLAVGVSSCTAALELSLRGLGLPPGGRVLLPAVTFCGVAQAVLHAGLRPVLVDVDPRTAMADPDTVARAARACGCPHAMTVLHYAGAPAPVAALAEAAQLPLTHVIEDAAHALGTTVGDRPVGSLSRATCFSFYATKNLPIGEGGMVTTDDPELAERIRRARLHGMSADAWRRNMPGGSWRYTVEGPGLKANMTDVQAAVGRAQLRHLDDWQQRRHDIVRRYTAALEGVPGIEPLDVPTPGRHACHLYAVRVTPEYGRSRDELSELLAERGIGTSVHFIPLHHMPYFRDTATVPPGGLPGADALFPQLLSLPLHLELADSAVDRVCDELARLAPKPRTPLPPPPAPAPAAVPPDPPRPTGLRTLVVGAGEAGRALARDLARTPQFGLYPVGFLDDDPDKRRAAVIGELPVLGEVDGVRETVLAHGIEAVVVAIPGLGRERFRQVVGAAEATGASVRYLPSFIAALRRDVVGSDMRALNVHQLIGRTEMHVVSPGARSTVAGRRVLVTGAGGSIGSELCHQVRAFGPSRLFLLDHDESNLHRLQLELYGDALLSDDIVISDIRDRPRIDQVFRELRPEIVFHAAAHKHLPLLERHPCEGVKSNVRGTENVVRAAAAAGTERFVLISTDKAADPVSVLGATKRLAELIVRDAQHTAPEGSVYTAVRFGNVLGSRGSLLSVVAEQLGSGAPVTVTHPDVTRFFMTVEEAVGLVLEAARMAEGGEVYVLDMSGPVRIVDLVRRFARSLNVPDVDIRFTGLRPGEKLNETLFSAHEDRTHTAHPRILAATSRAPGENPFALAAGLPDLYAATERNDTGAVRRMLAGLFPGFPESASGRQAPAVMADPYPDDF
ncbi:DegT/DnrJ/EryC1/StrS family aminotransferase [Streptomyces hilarionis]|uniref:DegT/DnrJ/EryC1/StrS family aminotransferase n=1 Tax=Streptomyces hilarionis TaxID=2839954 RepID=UPI00211A9BE5|nr:DegT/DnrJ/EryC1/StrS family aminotransferase [Streptomyces hilarionis]MCQ9132186.1 DegT/DnrJ/EryC1/StrS family aminotransferase [Streptomyces hilarionis]